MNFAIPMWLFYVVMFYGMIGYLLSVKAFGSFNDNFEFVPYLGIIVAIVGFIHSLWTDAPAWSGWFALLLTLSFLAMGTYMLITAFWRFIDLAGDNEIGNGS